MPEERQGASSAALFDRFPATVDQNEDQMNPAIRLYGRRFYKDQTPVEYLTEFLLVFSAPKKNPKVGLGSELNDFKFALDVDNPGYFPEDRLALKLFSFFAGSKLETRHYAHKQGYMDVLEQLKMGVSGGSIGEKEEAVRLLQSLFNGFVGVAKNRTWVTYSFLPVTSNLLSRELNWLHSKAQKETNLQSWKNLVEDNGLPTPYRFFAHDRHNFMARGGELLYLQLVNLFTQPDASDINQLLANSSYAHLPKDYSIVRQHLENDLRTMLEDSTKQLGLLVQWAEDSLSNYKLNAEPKVSNLGWVPAITRTEALLFAVEMESICASSIGVLDKLDLLQTLCCMQVLRSLCFQARRVDEAELKTPGFCGNYAWIVTDPNVKTGTPIRQMAQNSFNKIDEMLYRVLRSPVLYPDSQPADKDLKNGDENVFKHFRKFSKEIGLVVPRLGKGQRFTLHQGLLRFLVAALVKPGKRIRLTDFYQRVFAHYGIALGGEQLAVALNWCGHEQSNGSYAISSNTAWVEEALQQGGFLVELSDAVSMIKNPG
jgi:hypothetical protein